MGLLSWLKSTARDVVERVKDCGKAVHRAMVTAADWIDEKIEAAKAVFKALEKKPPIGSSPEAIAAARREITEAIRRDFMEKCRNLQNNALEHYSREMEHIKEQYMELLPGLLDFSRAEYEYDKAREKCEMARDEILREATSFADNLDYKELFTMKNGGGRTEKIREFESKLEKTMADKLRNDLASLMKMRMELINKTVERAAKRLMEGLEHEKGELEKRVTEKMGTLNVESSVVGDAETTRLCCELAMEILDEAEVA